MRRSPGLLACVATLSAALAAETSVRLGDATVRFDAARWKTTASDSSVVFTAQGEAERELDPVTLRSLSDDAPCATLAEHSFQFGHYDLSAILPRRVTIGGVAGERFSAHAGCRNATPRGEVMCVKVGKRTYMLEALQVGCGGRNLFSGIDPLGEIAAGISFSTAP